MDRKQFEKWFKTTDAYKLLEEMNYFKIDLLTFKEHRSQYQHTTVQIAYMTWQHQQAKVEELQQDLEAQREETIKGYTKISDLRLERDELQKRVDNALQIAKQGIRKQGGNYYLEQLEQALKGDES